MSSDAQKRVDVANMYPHSERWARRVKNMPDAQVYAIWVKLQNQTQSQQNTKEKDEEDEIPF